MSYNKIFTEGTEVVTVPATESIAIQSYSPARVFSLVGFPNFPNSQDLLGVVNNTTTVFGPFTAGATITIQAGASEVLYAVGTAPVVSSEGKYQLQGTPGVLNASGTLTAAMMLSGIVTSTSAAPVTGTLDTGVILDLASEFAIGDSFDWAVINTGPSTVTVTASAGHTVLGVGAVLTLISAMWRTRKTAANAFITSRLS